jgi:hypothetical protein
VDVGILENHDYNRKSEGTNGVAPMTIVRVGCGHETSARVDVVII